MASTVSRFLTPAKLCLLLLIELYSADEIPAGAKLHVLCFIATSINVSSGEQAHAEIAVSPSAIASFNEALSSWQSAIPGRTLYDALIARIWSLTDLDGLHTFFHNVQDLVASSASNDSEEDAATKISRASPLGQFIRRCCLEFTRLQFSESQALWNALVAYRAPTYSAWASRHPDLASQQQAGLLPWATASNGRPTTERIPFFSADDAEQLLNSSIHHLQKLGHRVSPPLKAQLIVWLRSIGESGPQSLQHFLSFFEHWRAGQYTMALEYLHRYFDYSLATTARREAENSKEAAVKIFYQYALLHLSVLHADFDRWDESGDAMAECIATGNSSPIPPR